MLPGMDATSQSRRRLYSGDTWRQRTEERKVKYINLKQEVMGRTNSPTFPT
jgi:hypothetical protein